MNATITKAINGRKQLRAHRALTTFKTLCGLQLEAVQESLEEVDCQRCLKSLRREQSGKRRRINQPRIRGMI